MIRKRDRDLIGKGLWFVADTSEPGIDLGGTDPVFADKDAEAADLLAKVGAESGKAYRCRWAEWRRVNRKIVPVTIMSFIATA